MTWLVPKLNKRIQVRIPVDTANDSGGLDRSYTTTLTIWGGFKPVKEASYIRGSQTTSLGNVQNRGTHEFTIRRIAIATLGTAFGRGFGAGFDSISDQRPLKSEFFFFVQDTAVKGKLFRIINIMDHNEQKEFLIIRAEEIEEQGTGHPE